VRRRRWRLRGIAARLAALGGRGAATDQQGTPPPLIALIHGTFGGPPDLDPASSPGWNDLTRARRTSMAEDDALAAPGVLERCISEETEQLVIEASSKAARLNHFTLAQPYR
jgi:hypothetical protein